MLNYIAIIEPFKLQCVTIVEKSEAFGWAQDWFSCLYIICFGRWSK